MSLKSEMNAMTEHNPDRIRLKLDARIAELERENERLRDCVRAINKARRRLGWKRYELDEDGCKWLVELHMTDSEYDAYRKAVDP